MALLCGRLVLSSVRRTVSYPTIRCASTKVTMGDSLEHATALKKRELPVAGVAGNESPFDMKIIEHGPGTEAQPNEIPSAFDARIVGCICEEEATTVNWMWLHKGQPRKCECGHWFTLVHKAPL